MSERDGYPHGVPCWVDLNTSDVPAGQAFYGQLFGWEWKDVGPAYTFAMLRGRKVCGIAAADPGQAVAWTTSFAVADADAAVAAATAAGGTIEVPVREIPGQGRVAVALDPAGASFGVWQAYGHRGAELVDEPGTVVWNELVTSDLAAAAAFYPAVLGVDIVHLDTGDTGVPYDLVKVGGRTVAGALTRLPGMAHVPPHWGVYFEVTDADAAAADAARLGATPLSPVTPSPQGPMAAFLDPQGAAFAIIASGSTE